MGWVSGIATFVLIWWIVLFAILPLWVRADSAAAPGGWRGTPERPLLRRKLAVTTAVAALLWLVLEVLVSSELFSFRSGWLALPPD